MLAAPQIVATLAAKVEIAGASATERWGLDLS
jgi:hypothetical protein